MAGTEGYAESVEYVAGKLRKAGYDVTLDPFDFQFVFPALLRQISPVAADYETGTFTGSGDGDITGTVIPVDINLVPPRASTSACEASRLRRPQLQRADRHRPGPARHLPLRRRRPSTPRPPVRRP